MTQLARTHVYWPRNNPDISEYVKCCTICARHKASQTVQPMLPRDVPNGPWQELATDCFTHYSKDYLLNAKPFSKYPFIYRVHSKTSDSLTKCLQDLFSQYGTPKRFLSDSGLPFSSEPFSKFLSTQGIDHLTSSPLYPKSMAS